MSEKSLFTLLNVMGSFRMARTFKHLILETSLIHQQTWPSGRWFKFWIINRGAHV